MCIRYTLRVFIRPFFPPSHRGVVDSNPDVPITYWSGLVSRETVPLLSNRVERHLYDSYQVRHKNESGFSPITENDDFRRRSTLVVMLVIGLRAANYIKLVSHG